MEKVVFVILHYKTQEETIESTRTILEKVYYDNKEIVIVDNGSRNGSYEKIKEFFLKQDNVYCIKSEKNLGFARGNNIGFYFAKEQLKADFIVLLNSDVIIEQRDFCEKVIQLYRKKNYHVLGGDIRLPDGTHCNPVEIPYRDIKSLKKTINRYQLYIILCKCRVELIVALIKRVLRKVRNKTMLYEEEREDNIQLHGCCWIFSPLFVERYDGLCEISFLYEEESILRYICDRDQLKMYYSPEIKVLHNESVSVKKELKNRTKRHLFYYENSLASCMALYGFIWSNSENKQWK